MLITTTFTMMFTAMAPQLSITIFLEIIEGVDTNKELFNLLPESKSVRKSEIRNEIPKHWAFNLKAVLSSVEDLISCYKMEEDYLYNIFIYLLWMSMDDFLKIKSSLQRCTAIIINRFSKRNWPIWQSKIALFVLSAEVQRNNKWNLVLKMIRCISYETSRGVQLFSYISYLALRKLTFNSSDPNTTPDYTQKLFEVENLMPILESISRIEKNLQLVAIKFIDLFIWNLKLTSKKELSKLCISLKRCGTSISKHATRRQYYLSVIYSRMSTLASCSSTKQMFDFVEEQEDTSNEEDSNSSQSSLEEQSLNTESNKSFDIDTSNDMLQKDNIDLQSTITNSLEAEKEIFQDKNHKENSQKRHDVLPFGQLKEQTKNIVCNTSNKLLLDGAKTLESIVSSAVPEPETKSNDELEVISKMKSDEETETISECEDYESKMNVGRKRTVTPSKLVSIHHDHDYIKKEQAAYSTIRPSKNLNTCFGKLNESNNQCEYKSAHSFVHINASSSINSLHIPDIKKSTDMQSQTRFTENSEKTRSNFMLDPENHTSTKNNINMESDNFLCTVISKSSQIVIQNDSIKSEILLNPTTMKDLNSCAVSENLGNSVNNTNVISNIGCSDNGMPSELIRSNEDIGLVIEKLITEMQSGSTQNKTFQNVLPIESLYSCSSSDNSRDSLNNREAVSNIEHSAPTISSVLGKSYEVDNPEIFIDAISEKTISHKNVVNSENNPLPLLAEISSNISNSFPEELNLIEKNFDEKCESVSQRNNKKDPDFSDSYVAGDQNLPDMQLKDTHDTLSPLVDTKKSLYSSLGSDANFVRLQFVENIEKMNSSDNEKHENFFMPSLDNILNENQNCSINTNIKPANKSVFGSNFNHDNSFIDHQNITVPSKQLPQAEVSTKIQPHSLKLPNKSCSSPKRKHADRISHLVSKRGKLLKTVLSGGWTVNFPGSSTPSSEHLNRGKTANIGSVAALTKKSSIYYTEICNSQLGNEIPAIRESFEVNASHSGNKESIEIQEESENINTKIESSVSLCSKNLNLYSGDSNDSDSRNSSKAGSSSSSNSELKQLYKSQFKNLNGPNINESSFLDNASNTMKDSETVKSAVSDFVESILSNSDDDIQIIEEVSNIKTGSKNKPNNTIATLAEDDDIQVIGEFSNSETNTKNKSYNFSATLAKDKRKNCTSLDGMSPESIQSSLKCHTESTQLSQTVPYLSDILSKKSMKSEPTTPKKFVNPKQRTPKKPVNPKQRTPKKPVNPSVSNSNSTPIKKLKLTQTLLTTVPPASTSIPTSSTKASNLIKQGDLECVDPDCYIIEDDNVINLE
ncbi:hypothetical protein HNY73_016996 [Argiope bruennichi]|uniref:Uncharacterized protein n=1 Tax=Argiope bruennichi TaxID=94029 RepID=A0A8T0EKM2_ARGBR|nr:hypothetical protein HNY73_016996 [Argiope bruennichi]